MATDKYATLALALLRQALEPRMRLHELAQSTENGPQTVELRGPGRPPQRLRLVPWARHDRYARRGAIVWILRRYEAPALKGLVERDESFIDLRGRVRIATPHLYVDRSNLSLRSKVGDDSRLFDPFADRASLIARAMLERANNPSWTVRELARTSGVSPDTASIVLRQLEVRGIVKIERAGRSSRSTLVSARRLIEQWTEAYRWTRNTAVSAHAPIGSPLKFVERLGRQLRGHRWALTMHAGAYRIAPHASWDKTHVYLDVSDRRELARFAAEQGWQPAADGRLVLMRPYYKKSVWHGVREDGDFKVVSMIQLILDLWHYPVRGREQAEQLLELYLSGRHDA